MVHKDLFKNNQRPTVFFFFHYSLDIVYLINNRDTLGAQIVDTVKNKGGGNMVKMKRGSKALCSRIGASKLKSCL